jgi:D-glycero-alpha-D-manno-heptose 1-phosphate guanylyltransferase
VVVNHKGCAYHWRRKWNPAYTGSLTGALDLECRENDNMNEMRHLTALIPAGGLGTRLRSVVQDRPKPMADINGAPFLEIVVRCFHRKGLRHFVFLVGYKGEMIENHFKNLPGDWDFGFSREVEPLGTGGAIKKALSFASEPCVSINGDTFFDADLNALLNFHREKRGSATLALYPVADVSRYGSVELNHEGRITRFTEKSDAGPKAGLINAGVTILSRDFIASLPDGAFSMEQDVYPKEAAAGRLFGLAQDRAFFDIGTPESYADFTKYAAMNNITGKVACSEGR